MNLFVIALIPLLVEGQEITTNCWSLPADTACGPEYKDQPIYDTSNPDQGFPSVDGFNQYIRQFSNETQQELPEAELGCNPDDVTKKTPLIRYQTSFWCSFYVKIAIQQGCTPKNPSTPNGLLLCKPQCDRFITSLKESLSSCSNMSTYNETLDMQCKDSPLENCFTGTELENINCGWSVSNMSITQRNCKLVKNNSCCNSLLQRQEKEKKSQAQPKSWSWWVILLVSIGGVVFLVGVFFLVKFLSNIARRKRNSDQGKQVNLSSSEEALNGDKNINGFEVNTKQQDKAANPTKSTKSNEVKKRVGLFNRFRKNFPSLADDLEKDLEKGKAEGDKSLKSLMKFFGSYKDLKNQNSTNPKPNIADPSLFSTDIPPASRVESNQPVNAVNGQKSEANDAVNDLKSEANDTVTVQKSEANNSDINAVTTRKSLDNISVASRASRKSVEIGKTVVVVDTYEARSRDELSLVIGALIKVETQFDDGWAVGIEEKTKRKGVFPLICTAKIVT